MSNQRKRVWIDPNSSALAYLKKCEPKTVHQEIKERPNKVIYDPEALPPAKVLLSVVAPPETCKPIQEVVHQPKVEVLPPAAPLPPATVPDFPMKPPKISATTDFLPDDLMRLEWQLRQIASTLDFNLKEGFLDRWFGRLDHRLETKIERAHLIAEFQAAELDRIHNAAEKVRAIDQVRYQQFLDRLVFWRTAAEEHYRVLQAQRTVERQQAIEDAKARAEIAETAAKTADCRKRIIEAERPPLPPPTPTPPPAPPPSADEIRMQNKQGIEQEINRLHKDEEQAINKIILNLPKEQWSEEQQDDVMRTKNMYEDARERKRDELRKYL